MISRESVLIGVFAGIAFIGAASYFMIKDEIAFTNFWMLCNALTYPVLLSIIWLLSKDKQLKIAVTILISLSIGEVMDELFFDPVKWGWPEVLNFIVAIIIGIYLCRKKRV